jgi:hypothetical protein
MKAPAMKSYLMDGQFGRGAHTPIFALTLWSECAAAALRSPAGRTDMIREHVCMQECNVRHFGNGIVARLPTAMFHAIDHLLHEHPQFARLSAFSLSAALAADADGTHSRVPFWLARRHLLGNLP